MSEKKSDGHGNLTYYIIGAIIVAISTGYFAPEIATKFKVGGEVFLSLLMMMVVPLVVSSAATSATVSAPLLSKTPIPSGRALFVPSNKVPVVSSNKVKLAMATSWGGGVRSPP